MSDANVTIEALEDVRQALLEFRSDTDAVYTKLRRTISYIINSYYNIINDTKMHIEVLREKISDIKTKIDQSEDKIYELDTEIREIESELSDEERKRRRYESLIVTYPANEAEIASNQSIESAATSCRMQIYKLEQKLKLLLSEKSDEEYYHLAEYKRELEKAESEFKNAEQHLSMLQLNYSYTLSSLEVLNSRFSSFVRSADSETSGNVMALDKCIDAISDYMNT